MHFLRKKRQPNRQTILAQTEAEVNEVIGFSGYKVIDLFREKGNGKREKNCKKRSTVGCGFNRTDMISKRSSDRCRNEFGMTQGVDVLDGNAPHPDFLMFGEPHIENRPQPLKGGGYAREIMSFFSRLTSHFSLKKSNGESKPFPLPSFLFPKPKSAFTLAEVLITLGIIGVVAAMTLPSLIIGQQKQTTATRLEKVFSVINQGFLNAQNEVGSSQGWGNPTAE